LCSPNIATAFVQQWRECNLLFVANLCTEAETMNLITIENNSIVQNQAQKDGRFHRLFEHFDDALLIVNPETDEILDANSQACSLLDYHRTELLAKPIPALHP
jgi:PAS domain-containing protein